MRPSLAAFPFMYNNITIGDCTFNKLTTIKQQLKTTFRNTQFLHGLRCCACHGTFRQS